MESKVIVALIAAIVSIATSFVFRAWERRAERLSVVKRYGAFLYYAAKSLEGVIREVLEPGFAKKFHQPGDKKHVYAHNAVNYTAFLFCQYFAWREIIVRDQHVMKGLDAWILDKTRTVAIKFANYDDIDKPDENNQRFLIFRGEQRVLGEFCIILSRTHKSWWCIGVDNFINKLNDLQGDKCHLSIEKLVNDIEALLDYQRNGEGNEQPGIKRLEEVRSELEELIKILKSPRLFNRFRYWRESIGNCFRYWRESIGNCFRYWRESIGNCYAKFIYRLRRFSTRAHRQNNSCGAGHGVPARENPET